MRRAGAQHLAGRYELLRLLGRGGMGEVYLARDCKFDRLVALKFFNDNPDYPEARARFLKEAVIAGRLLHPHIVTVYDFGDEDEVYIAMEYIAGETLAQLIRRRMPESLHEKVRLMIELCAGLAAAHDAGVLHRDIKPANLMLAPGGGLKIVDFGIARALDSRSVTQALVGSLHYMSPEQLALAPLDARSDVFAAGAVFYELLAFQQAFAGDSLDAVVERIRFGSPEPLDVVCPGLNRSLISIVERALQNHPDARFPDVRSMQRELRTALRTIPAEDPEPTVTLNPRLAPTARGGAETEMPDPPSVLPAVRIVNRWARVQARVLDPRAVGDYLWLAIAAAAPILISWAIDAHRNVVLDPSSRVYAACLLARGSPPVVLGYLSRLNWWPLVMIVPFALYVLRRTGIQLFPLHQTAQLADTGMIRKIPVAGRAAVAVRLSAAALDPRNIRTVVFLVLLINLVDLGETISHYASAFLGSAPVCPREFDWTVRFFAAPPVSMAANAGLVLAAYPSQFLAHSLTLMIFTLLFRHNLFYLNHIYQLQRARRRPAAEQIVLDFDDVERCFGLRELHSTFNYQVIVLITGGCLILLSRLMNVDVTPLGEHYEDLLARMLSTGPADHAAAGAIGVRDLFPDFGQVMLGLGWMACFVIVAMPSAVKFLPLIHKHVRLVGRREYLLEFLPATTTARLNTQDEVDALARKFARSSFWPAGDERARTLYLISYFVFLIVLIPAPPTSQSALALHLLIVFVFSYACMRLTFWFLRKTLINVDTSLADE